MLADAPPGPADIIVVAVPPLLHAPMATLGVEAGFEVLCEKLLARGLAKVGTILAAAARVGRMQGDCAFSVNGQRAACA